MCLWEDRENRKNNFTKEKRESQKKLKRLDIPRLGGVSLKMKDEDMGLA